MTKPMSPERLEEILQYKNDCPCLECQSIRAMAQEIKRCWDVINNLNHKLIDSVQKQDGYISERYQKENEHLQKEIAFLKDFIKQFDLERIAASGDE